MSEIKTWNNRGQSSAADDRAARGVTIPVPMSDEDRPGWTDEEVEADQAEALRERNLAAWREEQDRERETRAAWVVSQERIDTERGRSGQ